MANKKKLITFFVLFLCILTQSPIDIYLPSLPHIVTGLHTTVAMGKLTLTFYLVSYAIFQLIYGPLSDHFGRRPVLLFGIFFGTIGTIICTVAPNIHLLIFGRLIQGFGICSVGALARAILRDSFEGQEMAEIASYMAIAWALVPIIAPLIGGYIQDYLGWRAVFGFLVVFVSISWFLVFFLLPETLKPENHIPLEFGAVLKNYLYLLRSRIFIGHILVLTALFNIFISYNVIAPFLFQTRLGYSAIHYGWITFCIAIGFIIGSYVNSRIIKHHNIYHVSLLALFGLTIISTILILFALMNILNIWTLIIPLFFIFMLVGFSFPNVISMCLSPFSKIAGSAGSMYGFIIMIGGSFLTYITTHLHERTQLPLAIILFALSTAALLIFSYMLISSKENNAS